MSRTQTSKNRSTPNGEVVADSPIRPVTLGDRIFLKVGHAGAQVVHLFATLLLFALVLFADYLIVLFTAVNVLPNIAVLIQQGTGVTLDARLDAVIAGWLIPVLFIVAAVLVGEIFLMRRLWLFATNRKQAMGRSLFRMEAETQSVASPSKVSAKPSSLKTATAS